MGFSGPHLLSRQADIELTQTLDTTNGLRDSTGLFMHYNISVSDTCVSVIFSGTLSAIDLIFMNQDPRYRESIVGKKTLFLDFSQIVASELTREDTEGLMLLGKLDSQRARNIQLVILVRPGGAKSMSELCHKIFADSSWQVAVFESRADAMKLL